MSPVRTFPCGFEPLYITVEISTTVDPPLDSIELESTLEVSMYEDAGLLAIQIEHLLVEEVNVFNSPLASVVGHFLIFIRLVPRYCTGPYVQGRSSFTRRVRNMISLDVL